MPNTTQIRKIRPASRAGRSTARDLARKLAAADRASLDSRLVKRSKARIVVSGNIVEEYRYEREYLFNLAPSKARTAENDAPRRNTTDKRDDHILRARRMIRRLIDANVDGLPIFVTYTFARNVRTLEEANPKFTAHVKELQRRYGKVRYLCVPEFQKRGAVHYHVIYFNLPYIPKIKQVMNDLWPHGWSQVRAIRKVKRIGLYVAKYLQKGVDDRRTRGRKSYFTSRELIRPYEIREQEAVDNFVEHTNMTTEFEGAFEGPFGSVRYYRHKINT